MSEAKTNTGHRLAHTMIRVRDLEKSIARRMAAAEEQIDSAQAAAVKEVRDQAVVVAIAAAKDVIAKKMTAAEGNALIDSAIAEVDTKLH